MVPYPMPEWLAAVAENYRANPDNQNRFFKGWSYFITYRVLADEKFGLEKDIYFGSHIEDGILQDDDSTCLMSPEEAKRKSDFIVSAPADLWKKIIQKKESFMANFMGGRVKLEMGDARTLISLGSRAPALVDNLYKVDTEWPDEMPPERLEGYKARMKQILDSLGY